MKHKSYRDRYFEDYQAVRQPCNNKKGYRVIYKYVGLWVAWYSEKINIKSCKMIVGIWELVSIGLYFVCASVDTSINNYRLASGFGTLAIAPWLFETIGVLRFCLSKECVTELDYEEIDKSIRVGGLLHMILSACSVIVGCIMAFVEGTFESTSVFPALGMIISIGLTYAIWHAYRDLFVQKYHNEDGKVGSRC